MFRKNMFNNQILIYDDYAKKNKISDINQREQTGSLIPLSLINLNTSKLMLRHLYS